MNAKRSSNVEIMYSRFQNNQGLNGGGIFHLGDAYVKGSVFLDNRAPEGGGGAIYAGSDATGTLLQNIFAGNEAAFFGPAVFDGSGAATSQEENSGCGNSFTNGASGCDGISSLQSGAETCDEFIIDCLTPTSSPTSPTASPSSLPTITPSVMPTARPPPVSLQRDPPRFHLRDLADTISIKPTFASPIRNP